MTRRAVIYARVSTAKEEQRTSIPGQLADARDYCARQGWAVVAEQSDMRTGRNMQRPGWQAVLGLIAARGCDVLVVRDRSRISRSRQDYEDFKANFLRPNGVEVAPLLGIRVEADNLWTEFAEEDEVRDAERYVRMLAWRTRQGMRRRAADGYCLKRPPYGYRPVAGRRGEVEAHPQHWPVVERLFAAAARGEPLSALARWLNTLAAGQRGGAWTPTQVKRLLVNPFYRGVIVYDGQEYAGRHTLRIAGELWDQAQPLEPAAPGRPQSHIYVLPRVVSSAWEVVAGDTPTGRALPLRPSSGRCRNGERHYFYTRADRLSGAGYLGAQAVAAHAADLPRSYRAEVLEDAVLDALLARYRRAEWYSVDVGGIAAERRAGLEAELAAARESVALAHREQSLARRRLAESFTLAPGLLELHAGLDALARQAGERAASQESRIQELERELALGASLAQGLAAAQRRVPLLAGLRERGERALLREALDLLVDCVDVRADSPVVIMRLPAARSAGHRRPLSSARRPATENVSLAAPTGIEPVFSP